ncbi:P-loop containing nucleoside triphosphate hydrolases superfamily protein [Striga hermonthica]|uniref:P-loop containing nucleoside triphosphate hydrolases superfamily protein n=1 Tax=Striga hermonthica TaxID=68872 RepID=A0A9N7N960_STRHE|nr:P-loop containing nucleoside triphosphate hydrolases superfamily protein [Striga hermonthica]
MIKRKLSPLRLKSLLSPFFFTTYVSPNTLHAPIRQLPSLNPSKTLTFIFLAKPFSSQSLKNQSFPKLPLTRDGNYEEDDQQHFPICPGCGIRMQDIDPKQPGFFIEPAAKGPNYKRFRKMVPVLDDSEISDSIKRGFANEILDVRGRENPETEHQVFEKMPQKFESPINSGPDGRRASQLPVVCARCHSLRHYEKVKDPSLENLLPDFDFNHTVGKRLVSVGGARTVVLFVVDAVDFDGSFPRKVADTVYKTIDENLGSWKEGKSGNIPRVLLVVTKIDLLPSSISPTRLDHWVRSRAREGGAGKITGVHLVSAMKEWGVRSLVDDVVKFAGQRGNVWAVGAQNAGKSTLINAIGKCAGMRASNLTEASVPGTTLGIVKMEGVLPGKAKLLDTPGLLHPHQVSTRLTLEEQKLVRVDKELKPRTYRINAGHSVHIGGLLRLDLEESSVDSIYVTVWASSLLPLHMGKTENASRMLEEHFGRQLQPPIGAARVKQLGRWVKKEFLVNGDTWNSSSVDIAAAGLGWFAIGLKGEAQLGIWTYEGVDVVVRNALLPQRSRSFEVAGFTVSEIVSKADRARNKQHQNSKKLNTGNLANKDLSLNDSSSLMPESNSSCSTPLILNVDTGSNLEEPPAS